MDYTAILFRQNTNSPPQLLFVTSTAAIDDWARVPTRMTSRPEGFQRTEVRGHVEDLKEFFEKDTSHSNSSPTSLLIGFDPARQSMITVHDEKGTEISLTDPLAASKKPRIVTLKIAFDAWDSSQFQGDLAKEITALFSELETLGVLDAESADTGQVVTVPKTDGDGSSEGVTASVVPATEVYGEEEDATEIHIDEDTDEDELSEDEEESNESVADSTSGTPANASESIASADAMHGATASAVPITPANVELQSLTNLRTAWATNAISSDCQPLVRDLLKTARKPGLIIDGQHRVKATRDADYPFSVSFLPLSPWEELAFQFIVNNHTAKKVDENLLTAIVGQSLDDAQLQRIESRLSRAGIKVQLIKAATRVQVEDNPFRGMLMTGTEGEQGFLRSTAMQSNVLKLWYGDQSKRGKNIGQPTLASFQLLSDDSWALRRFAIQKLFLVNCDGRRVLDRKLSWQKEMWFHYFKAFWTAVKEVYLPSKVWPSTPADWPVPDRRMTPDQERVNKFMRTTLLGPFQLAVMQRWAERRFESNNCNMVDMAKQRITPEQFLAEIRALLEPLTADFFTSLSASGFQGSASVRDNMKQMLWQILKRTKTVADIKASSLYGQYFE
jgi:hypothetical protein